MSNPTELPYTDADILELVGLAQRMREIKHWEMQAGSKILAEIAGRMHTGLIGRAQPEGEAPQADAAVMVPKFEGQFDSHQDWVNRAQRVLSVPSHKPSAICVDAKGRRCHIGADMRRASEEGVFPVRYFWECELATPAATLSPLCGAQHAESGNEAIYQVATDKGFAWSDVTREIYDQYAGSDYRRRIVYDAQQAAAPGALAQHCPFCGSTDEVYHGKVTYCDNCGADGPSNERDGQPVAKWSDRVATSAPGTPEVPKGSIEDYNEFNRLLDNLEGAAYEAYSCGNDFGTGDKHQAAYEKLVAYIDSWACPRAAQLDGGQEGSDHA